MVLRHALSTICLVSVLSLSNAVSAAPVNGDRCRELSRRAGGNDALYVQTASSYQPVRMRQTLAVRRLEFDRRFVFVPRARWANRALVILTKAYGTGSEEVRTVRIERQGFRDDRFDLDTYNQYHRNYRDNVVLARKFHFEYEFGGARRRTDDRGRRERFLFEGVESPSTSYTGTAFRSFFMPSAVAADERPVKLNSYLYDQAAEPQCIAFTVDSQPGATQIFIQIERLDQPFGTLKWHLQQARD